MSLMSLLECWSAWQRRGCAGRAPTCKVASCLHDRLADRTIDNMTCRLTSPFTRCDLRHSLHLYLTHLNNLMDGIPALATGYRASACGSCPASMYRCSTRSTVSTMACVCASTSMLTASPSPLLPSTVTLRGARVAGKVVGQAAGLQAGRGGECRAGSWCMGLEQLMAPSVM